MLFANEMERNCVMDSLDPYSLRNVRTSCPRTPVVSQITFEHLWQCRSCREGNIVITRDVFSYRGWNSTTTWHLAVLGVPLPQEGGKWKRSGSTSRLLCGLSPASSNSRVQVIVARIILHNHPPCPPTYVSMWLGQDNYIWSRKNSQEMREERKCVTILKFHNHLEL